MDKIYIYKSFAEWRKHFYGALMHIVKGVVGLLFCFIMGVISLVVNSWRATCRFVCSNPDIALAAFLFVSIMIWMLTFVCMRVRAVGAEHQRDSIAWQYSNFKATHGYDE